MRSRPWPRQVLPLLLIACLLPFYWVSYTAPAVGMMHDDGLYLVTAKALAEGKGYRIVSLPDEPRQTKYPVGFPLLIALIWRMFPDFPENVSFLKLVPVVSLMSWLGMAIWFARRWGRMNWSATLWLVFLCAGTRWSIFAATNFLSDLLWGALALAALHFILAIGESARPVYAATLAGAFVVAAYNVRTSSVALMAGGFAWLLLTRRVKPAVVFGGICMAAVLIWTAWQSTEDVPHNPIESYYTSQNYVDWNLLTANYSLSEKAAVLATNVFALLIFPSQVISSSLRFLPAPAAVVIGAPAWIMFFRGTAGVRTLRPAYICLAFYAAVIVLWAWLPERFLVPMLPLLLVLAYHGLPRALKKTGLAFAAAAVVLAGAWSTAQAVRAKGVPWIDDERPLEWGPIAAMHEWIRRNSGPEDVILAAYDPAVFLYTGRRAIRAFEADNLYFGYRVTRNPAEREAAFRAEVSKRGVRYLLVTPSEPVAPGLSDWIERLRQDGVASTALVIREDYRIYSLAKPNP